MAPVSIHKPTAFGYGNYPMDHNLLVDQKLLKYCVLLILHISCCGGVVEETAELDRDQKADSFSCRHNRNIAEEDPGQNCIRACPAFE